MPSVTLAGRESGAWTFGGVQCDRYPSGHRSLQYPDLDSNQDQDLRRVLCDPLHHRDVIFKSRRLDSHQHQPVYKTGAFLSRATSASSTSARSRTPCGSFGGCLLSQEHTRVRKLPAHAAGSDRCQLLLQLDVPVRLADELRPAFDPQLVSRVERLPRRPDRPLAQPHPGLLRRAVGLPLVARHARQHAVVPASTCHPAPAARRGRSSAPRCRAAAAVLARVVVPLEDVAPAERDGRGRQPVVARSA